MLANAFKYINKGFYTNQIDDVPSTRKISLVNDPNRKLDAEKAKEIDNKYRVKSKLFYVPNLQCNAGYNTRFIIYCNIGDVCDIVGTIDIYHTVKVSELTSIDQIELWLPKYTLLSIIPEDQIAINVFNNAIK